MRAMECGIFGRSGVLGNEEADSQGLCALCLYLAWFDCSCSLVMEGGGGRGR